MALFAQLFAMSALADDFCETRDDKKIAELNKAVSDYIDANLKVHTQHNFSRPLVINAKRKARSLLEEKILDKKTELCADRLKLVEDIKAEPPKWENTDCSSAGVFALIDAYVKKVALSYDDSRKIMNEHQKDHLRELRRKFFEMARAPKPPEFSWIKDQATKLVGEARRVWGAVDTTKNPLVQENLSIAREAIRYQALRDTHKPRDPSRPPVCHGK